MRLHTLLLGRPATMGRDDAKEPMQRVWTSAIFKESVAEPVMLHATGLDGDGQADTKNHGGPDKAVLAYARGHLDFWNARFPSLHMVPGAFGENFCVDGATETDVCIGDVFSIGSAVVEVSQPRMPCWKLARRWGVKDLSAVAQREGRVGWYLRVLTTGLVQAGQDMVLHERPNPTWTVQRAHDVMHHSKENLDAAREPLSLTALSASWKAVLQRRVAGEAASNPAERLVGPNESTT